MPRQLSQNGKLSTVAWAIVCLCSVGGCNLLTKDRQARYETLPVQQNTESSRAQETNAKALWHLEREDYEKAESLFREALVQDVNYGPAHNNLGQLYLARRQLYLAAWEFEYASNLMPERVEPVLNHGHVYELAGRLDRAAVFYEIAYAMDSRHPVAIGNLARLRIKQSGDAAEIHHLLRELLLYDDRPDWIEWAERLLATQYDLGSNSSLESNLGSQLSPAATSSQPRGNLTAPIQGSPESVPADLPPPRDPIPDSAPGVQIRELQDFDLSRLQRLDREPGVTAGTAFPEDASASMSQIDHQPIQKVSFDEILHVER